VQPFFDWLGHFWWLIFPAMAMAGGIGRAWQRSLERRHKRRLEILRAKGELKAAQLAARAQPQAAVSAKGSAPTPSQLERLFAAHDEVTRRWLEYELDVAKLIAFPAMSDGRQPLTAAFLRAKKAADNLRPASAKAKLTAAQLAEYRDAVTDYEVAFDVAERDARRIKDSSFTDAERKRLDTAKQLLTVAIDQAATPAERQLAYRRVREELDGLISLSDGAIEVLEEKVALELTTGAVPRMPEPEASTAASAPPTAEPPAAAPQPEPLSAGPGAAREPKTGPWPVPARSSTNASGRVIRPKQHP
jgi:hypothetical protein